MGRKSVGGEADALGAQHSDCHLFALWLRASDLVTLTLSFFTCKINIALFTLAKGGGNEIMSAKYLPQRCALLAVRHDHLPRESNRERRSPCGTGALGRGGSSVFSPGAHVTLRTPERGTPAGPAGRRHSVCVSPRAHFHTQNCSRKERFKAIRRKLLILT